MSFPAEMILWFYHSKPSAPARFNLPALARRTFPTALISRSPLSPRCRRQRGRPGHPGGERSQEEQPCPLGDPVVPFCRRGPGTQRCAGRHWGGTSSPRRPCGDTRGEGARAGETPLAAECAFASGKGVPKRKVLPPRPEPPAAAAAGRGASPRGTARVRVSRPGYLLRCFNDSFPGAGDN